MKTAPLESYLLTSFVGWCRDSALSPMILVESSLVDWPSDADTLVFDLSPESATGLDIGAVVSFDAKLDGNPRRVAFPVSAVYAVWSAQTREVIHLRDMGDDERFSGFSVETLDESS